MKQGVVFDIKDRNMREVGGKHVIIRHDDDRSFNPITDNENVFLLHMNVSSMCGNEHEKDYESPLVEIEDEDGYGTGEYKFKDGVIAFPVSMIDHSGIHLMMGTVKCAVGDSPAPGRGGCGWDTTPNAGYLWTTQERYERLCNKWMMVYDKSIDKFRLAKTEKEFKDYLWDMAKGELEGFQMWMDGEVFGFYTEMAQSYKKVYPDGREVDGVEWIDGDDSCWGFITDKIDDIDFPVGDDWKVFDDTGWGKFVGDKYNIPEYVVVQDQPDGVRRYLSSYLNGEDKVLGGNAKMYSWTEDIDAAMTFTSWWKVQCVAQDVIKRDQYECYKNIAEIDKLRKKLEKGA